MCDKKTLSKPVFTANLRIKRKHPALDGHFPGNPIVPGVVILDNILQIWQKKNKKNINNVNNTKFLSLLRPDIICTIEYTEKADQVVHFLLSNCANEIICKGVFSYHA
jgi:3-hydroxyacyl-[acyl-carrier-protein] dehydratase